MKTLEELKARKKEVADRMGQIASESGEILTEETQTEFDSLVAESGKLDKQIDMTEKAMLAQQQAEVITKRPAPSIGRQTTPDPIIDPCMTRLPATVRKWGTLKCFKDDHDTRGDVKAFRFGQFIRGAVLGSEKARQWCWQNGMEIRGAMLEDNNSKGGYELNAHVKLDYMLETPKAFITHAA